MFNNNSKSIRARLNEVLEEEEEAKSNTLNESLKLSPT